MEFLPITVPCGPLRTWMLSISKPSETIPLPIYIPSVIMATGDSIDAIDELWPKPLIWKFGTWFAVPTSSKETFGILAISVRSLIFNTSSCSDERFEIDIGTSCWFSSFLRAVVITSSIKDADLPDSCATTANAEKSNPIEHRVLKVFCILFIKISPDI